MPIGITTAHVPWKIKPGYRASLNRANPITRGLIRYWPCGGAHLLDDIVVGHRMIPERNIVQRATQRGSLLSNTVSGDSVGDAYDLGPSNDLAPTGLTTYSLSMWLEGRAPSGTTGRRAFHIGRNSASPSSTLIGISVNGSGSAEGDWGYTDNTETFQSPNWQIAIHDDGLIHHCVLTIDGAAGQLHGYIDGEEDFEDLSITLTATRGTGPAYLGARGPVTDQAISDFGDCGIWQRVLSAAEVRSLYENPYQVYAPRTVIVPVSFDAGNGGPNLSMGGIIANP